MSKEDREELVEDISHDLAMERAAKRRAGSNTDANLFDTTGLNEVLAVCEQQGIEAKPEIQVPIYIQGKRVFTIIPSRKSVNSYPVTGDILTAPEYQAFRDYFDENNFVGHKSLSE